MNNTTAAIIFGLVGLVVGAMGSTYAWLKFVETGDRNRTLSSGRLQVQTLENLRDREIPTAIKTQQKMLDASIILVGGLLEVDAKDKEARVLLERFKKYRQGNPYTNRSEVIARDVERALSMIE